MDIFGGNYFFSRKHIKHADHVATCNIYLPLHKIQTKTPHNMKWLNEKAIDKNVIQFKLATNDLKIILRNKLTDNAKPKLLLVRKDNFTCR